jgi:hypothetical protein
MSQDEAFLNKLRERYPDLDGWRLRSNRADPEQPEPKSGLALDDAAFPTLRLSEMARISLVASGEHLRLASDGLEAGNAYNTAHFTTLRGALVAAAQAVWLLGPDEPAIRRERLRIFAAEMHKQMRVFYGEIGRLDLDQQERDAHAEQLRWLGERDEQIEALRTTSAHLSQTGMIEWALDFTFADKVQRDEGRLLWRQMSADAHTLVWSVIQRRHAAGPEGPDGLAVHQIGEGMIQHIAQPFECSYRLLKRGWSLFDQRCEVH